MVISFCTSTTPKHSRRFGNLGNQMCRQSLVHAIGPLLTLVLAVLVADVRAANTNIVKVQLIQTALDDGSNAAPAFDPVKHPNVAASVRRILAQAGIAVEFAPSLLRWSDTAAYRGDPGTYESGRRPSFDLISLIVFGAHNDGVVSIHSKALSLFFVGVCPDNRAGETAAVSTVAKNGIAIHFEPSYVENRPELAAVMIAHEICHNLGLYHVGIDGNLMTRFVGETSSALAADQIAAMLSTNTIYNEIANIPPGGTGFLHADTDGDGLTDEFELNSGLDPRDPADASRDRDGDGLSNLDEYRAGTDLNSASSNLRIDSIRLSESDVVVAFQTKPSYPYRLQMNDTLAGSTWTTVLEVIGGGEVIAATNRDAAAFPWLFFRLVVPR